MKTKKEVLKKYRFSCENCLHTVHANSPIELSLCHANHGELGNGNI